MAGTEALSLVEVSLGSIGQGSALPSGTQLRGTASSGPAWHTLVKAQYLILHLFLSKIFFI